MTTKKCDLVEKKLKNLIRFHNANKIYNYNRGGKHTHKNPIEQVKIIIIIKVFLELVLSESFPSLGVTVPLTSLGCPPTLC